MGDYLEYNDGNDPKRMLETASVILGDLVGSLRTIADLFDNVADGGGEASTLDSGMMAGLMRMLQSGAMMAKDKLDYGTEHIGRKVA